MEFVAIIVESVLTLAVGYAGWKFKKMREIEMESKQRKEDFEELELLNTRMNLIRECNRYIEKGFAPVYARTSIADIYKTYHGLGGNGGIESLYLRFLELPISENEESSKIDKKPKDV